MDNKVCFLWSWFIFIIGCLVFFYMSWCKEYEKKIISINRFIYTIKFEGGRCVTSIFDEKTNKE